MDEEWNEDRSEREIERSRENEKIGNEGGKQNIG